MRREIYWTSRDGTTRRGREWSRIVGVSYPTLYSRIERKGMFFEDAIARPSTRPPVAGRVKPESRKAAQSPLCINGREEAGRVQSLLFEELRRRKVRRHDFAVEMGWPSSKLSHWGSFVENSGTPWVDEMEACWNRLGFTLVPEGRWLRLDQSQKRLASGIHPILCVLFAALEIRELSRGALANVAGVHRNTLVNMATGRSRGKMAVVEACFGALGMPLRPRPLKSSEMVEKEPLSIGGGSKKEGRAANF